jgi:prevent-host-death family protein
MALMYNIAEARRQLPALVSQAGGGRPVVITRYGREAAVLVDLDFYYAAKKTIQLMREEGWVLTAPDHSGASPAGSAGS